MRKYTADIVQYTFLLSYQAHREFCICNILGREKAPQTVQTIIKYFGFLVCLKY